MNAVWQGAAKRIDQSDYAKLAAQRGLEEAVVRGIVLTEAAGSGFDKKGRLKALFEPHRFYRELGPGPKRDRAASEGLAYADWRPGQYPADSYPRIIAASKIDSTAALKATSWGLGQILASNHKLAGYSTPEAMVAAFAIDEENQLEGMFNFIKNRGLQEYARTRNWEKFAEGYNGKKFRVHGYHITLAKNTKRAEEAMKRPKRVPTVQVQRETNTSDLPSKPEMRPVQQSLTIGAKGPIVQAVQERLNKLGYFLRVDGSFGPRTRDMIMAVEADMQWPITGTISWDMLQRLDTVAPRAVPAERAERTAEDLKDESRIVQKSKTGERIAAVGVAVGAVTEGSKVVPSGEGSFVESVTEFLTPLQTIRDFVGEHWGFVAIFGGFVAWQLFKRIKDYRVQDHNTGKTV